MKIAVDTHTHSVASIHAYSTITEIARAARKNFLKGFVITDHGPSLQNSPHRYYFGNLRALPRKISGVFVFHGAELNIIDINGGLDLEAVYIKRLDFVMAGLHEASLAPASKEQNTKALIAAIENPLVDGISHPGNPAFPVDAESVVIAAAHNNKTLEINESSFRFRKGSDKTCREFASLCKKYGALITCASDAHFADDVGKTKTALSVIKEAGIEKEQIVNLTLQSFLNFINKRKTERQIVTS